MAKWPDFFGDCIRFGCLGLGIGFGLGAGQILASEAAALIWRALQ